MEELSLGWVTNQIKSNILLTNQGPLRGNKLNYKYTYKGERVV
jgi:hypothetical protein